MKPQNSRMNRRTVLRGVGVAMALPWLESIPVWGESVGTADVPQALPKRFAALFMGNGINPKHWWAKGAGNDMELSKSLQPMAPLRAKLNVITGLFNKHATGVGIHPGQTGNILSGAALQKGAVLKGGVSMDQVLATHLGEETPQPSLVLGCEQPITGYHETNFSMAYSSHISWQNATLTGADGSVPVAGFRQPLRQPGQPAHAEHPRPREGPGHRAKPAGQPGRSGKAGRVPHQRARGGKTDRTHSRDERPGRRQSPRPRAPALAMPRPDNGLPEDIREHMRLMCDIIAPGVPDRQDTRRDAAALPRPLRFVLSVPRRSDGPPSGLTRRPVRRLRARVAILRQPARISRRPTRRDDRGRAHRPRQLRA